MVWNTCIYLSEKDFFWHINNWKLKIEAENIRKQNKKIPAHTQLRREEKLLPVYLRYILQSAKYWVRKAFQNTGKYSKIGRTKNVRYQRPEHPYTCTPREQVKAQQIRAEKGLSGERRTKKGRRRRLFFCLCWLIVNQPKMLGPHTDTTRAPAEAKWGLSLAR